MFRKTILITALCMSSVTLSGCSSIWTGVSEFSADMAEVTKFSFLRGLSDKSDVSFAENIEAVDGVHKTEAGEYVPIYDKVAAVEPTEVEFFDNVNVNALGDTSPLPCPDGTFLNAENACMFLDVEEFDFGDEVNLVEQFVDTSPLPCPEGTYLNT